MSHKTFIVIMVMGTLFMGLKLGVAAKNQIIRQTQQHESQLEKAMMDLD